MENIILDVNKDYHQQIYEKIIAEHFNPATDYGRRNIEQDKSFRIKVL